MNPVTKIAVVVLVGIPLLLTLDAVSASVALTLEILVMRFFLYGHSISRRRFVALVGLVLIAALSSALVALLYATPGGVIFFEFGAVRISSRSVELALATGLRTAALALPAVMLFASTDVTALADALAQRARMPERFVFGALAGLRTLTLASADLAQVRRARRARGIRNGGPGVALPVFVMSLRRAETLAMAMEARAFDSGIPRSHFRQSSFSWRDAVGVALAFLISGLSTGIAIVMGAWHFVIA